MMLNMKKLMFFVIGMMFILSFTNVSAQKEKFHSLFIYNFSKYIKWPDDQQSDKFVIGVLGSSEMAKILEATASSKKVNGASIVVKQFKSPEEIQDCQILYVAQGESSKINEIASSTANRSVLIVTDKPGLAKKGGVINFIEQEGKIKFELNQQDAESRGLKVSSSLISLAVIV